MTTNRHIFASLAAALTLALSANAQSDDFEVSLKKSPTHCGLTMTFHGPANGTAILFAGQPAAKPIQTPYGKLGISNGFVRIKDINLSATGVGSMSHDFPNGLTVALQAALVDSNGKLTGLSSFGIVTLQRSNKGTAMACAWTVSQAGKAKAQMAIEAGPNAKVEIRDGSRQTVQRAARAAYVVSWNGWRLLFLLPNRIYAVYVDGIFMGYLHT